MDQPVKVLYINGNIMKRGGIESFMMNYFRRINCVEVKIDFLVHGYEKGEYDDEILAAGSKIIHVPKKSKHPLAYRSKLYKIFSSGEYKIVHSHCDAMSGWILKIAEKAGVPVRIAHSHNTAILTQNIVKLYLNEYYKKQIPRYATHMFACSKAAGEWMFGVANRFSVIPNAIELEQFIFNEKSRNNIRKKYNCENDIIVGHVGRFDYQKNHRFILEVWKHVVKNKRNYKLMLIGGGDLKGEIEETIIEYGVQDSVILAGVQENIAPFYSAFDIFILPSHFEGLPVVAIEAQANGLQCLLSNKITEEVCITKLVSRMSIDIFEPWVSQLCNMEINSEGREEESLLAKEKISKAGYEMLTAADKLKSFYINESKKINHLQ